MNKTFKLMLAAVTILFFAGTAMAAGTFDYSEPTGYTQLAMSKKPSAPPAVSNPCAMKNPCAANPCAMKNPCATNPCAMKNPCAANPCAANPCAANPCSMKNPCAANPCYMKNPCGKKW